MQNNPGSDTSVGMENTCLKQDNLTVRGKACYFARKTTGGGGVLVNLKPIDNNFRMLISDFYS